MKILITGAAGFLGSHLTLAATRAGHEVVGVWRNTKPHYLQGLRRVVSVRAELADAMQVNDLFATHRPQVIWHAAARIPQTGQETAAAFLADNVLATQHLLAAAQAYRVRHFVLSSSMSVYGTPDYLPVDEQHVAAGATPYAQSKLAAEQAAQLAANPLRVSVLRFSGIFGRGQRGGAIPAFIDRCLQHQPLDIHAGGRPSSDFVWVEDAAQAHLLTLRLMDGPHYQLFNIGSGVEFSVRQLAETIRDLTAARSPLNFPTSDSPRAFRFAYDIDRARQMLGYRPTAPAEALRHCIAQRAAGNWH